MDSTRKKITIILSLVVYGLTIGYVLELVNIRHLSLSLPVIMSLFSIELFSGKENPMLSIGTDLIGIVWICIPLLLSIMLSYPVNLSGEKHHDPTLIIGVMIFVFFNDSGAYFAGKYFGTHKLFPTISPKKTWEGSIGGALSSLGGYYFVKYLYSDIPSKTWFFIFLICVICGSIGDLIESMFKRDLKIKDTGSILPGHGGVLDRLDGILYSVPFVWSYLVFTEQLG
jgi:phosphatidate cytidylyltransferase